MGTSTSKACPYDSRWIASPHIKRIVLQRWCNSPTLNYVYLINYLMLMIFLIFIYRIYSSQWEKIYLDPHLAIWILFIYLIINENFGGIDSKP